uniref:Uncharacterized protein n=1 Tax=Cacopsylla melanoneura TaxID=428564 RepID=A0A8D8VMK6_9HEMI
MWNHPHFLQNVDEQLKHVLESILNLKLSDTEWCQATLPIRHGGLGVRKLADISLPAFLSSVHGVKQLVSTILSTPENDLHICLAEEALIAWNTLFSSLPDFENRTSQKSWDQIVVNQVISQQMNSDVSEDIARFKSLQKPESNSWLHAIPSKQVGTFVESRSFRVCVGLRLGSTICRPHPCLCGEIVDCKGIHALNCEQSKGRYSRHSNLNDIVKGALSTDTCRISVYP